jgi:hypothetical protein
MGIDVGIAVSGMENGVTASGVVSPGPGGVTAGNGATTVTPPSVGAGESVMAGMVVGLGRPQALKSKARASQNRARVKGLFIGPPNG